jgi:hypothetical protein
MIVFRHADPRLPFLWEDARQPSGRWHAVGEGPAHYFSDTPEGAWAELLRHEEITDPRDLETLRRAIWAVDLDEAEPAATPDLSLRTLTGDRGSYAACREAARALRARGVTRLDAPSAALASGGAHGHRVDAGLKPGPPRDGRTIVLYGRRPSLVGWRAAHEGRPSPDLVTRVRHFVAKA